MIVPSVYADEVDELRRSVRACLARVSTGPGAEWDAARSCEVWSRLSADIGVSALAVGERLGGFDSDATTLFATAEEVGAVLCPVPLLSTVFVASHVLTSLDRADATESLLRRIADGARVVVAAPADATDWTANSISIEVREENRGRVVDGCVPYVLDGASADVFLVPVRTGTSLALMAVEPGDNTSIEPLHTLDLSRSVARVTFRHSPAELVASGGGVAAALARGHAAGVAGLLAEQVGAATAITQMAVDYARTRHQFGRPIGSFQAVKHKLVDMAVSVERMSTALDVLVDDWPAPDAVSVSFAKTVADDAFFQITADAIQVHGGLGFTWEHAAHRYFRRAKADQFLFGAPAEHRRRLAAGLLGNL